MWLINEQKQMGSGLLAEFLLEIDLKILIRNKEQDWTSRLHLFFCILTQLNWTEQLEGFVLSSKKKVFEIRLIARSRAYQVWVRLERSLPNLFSLFGKEIRCSTQGYLKSTVNNSNVTKRNKPWKKKKVWLDKHRIQDTRMDGSEKCIHDMVNNNDGTKIDLE
jgi:hypothetical protein